MKFLVIDNGALHVDNARLIALDDNEVWYYCPWQHGFPKFEDGAPGYGIPEIKKVLDFAPYLDEADVIFFPDSGIGELAHTLREKGYRVFGAGRGEILEMDRAKSVEIMKDLGIACPETISVKGTTEALNFFKKAFKLNETNQSATGKYFVKLNIWRGTQDSFPVESYDIAEYMLKDLDAKFGPYSKSIELIIQKTVEGIECGADLIFTGEHFLKPAMIGFESSNSYIGYMTDDLSIYKSDLEKFEKYLASVNYRGFFSFECFFDGKQCSYIDITPRTPMPLGLMYPTFAKNYPGLIYDVAEGTATDSHFELGTFLGGAEVESDNAKSSWLPLTAGKNTRLMRYMMQDGQAFSVPGGEATVAMVCATGSSMQDVEQKIQKEAEQLNIFFSKCSVDYLDKVRENYIEPLKELGFDFDALTGSNEKHDRSVKHSETNQDQPESIKDPVEDIRHTRSKTNPVDEAIEMIGKEPIDLPKPKAMAMKPTGRTFATPVDNLGIPFDM